MKKKITLYNLSGLIAFGNYISQVRGGQNISKGDLASRLGVEEKEISLIEDGKYFVDFNDAKKIARALDINPKAIAGFYGEKVVLTEEEWKVLTREAPKGASLIRED